MNDDTPTESFGAAGPDDLPASTAPLPDATTALPSATPPGDDLPTMLLASGTGGVPPQTPPTSPTPGSSRRTIITLAIIGGVLVIALLIALAVLLARGAGVPVAVVSPTPSTTGSASNTPTPTPTKTPTPTPTPTQTAAPPPPPPPTSAAKIETFSTGTPTVVCDMSSPTAFPSYVTFAWSSSNVNQVIFGIEKDGVRTVYFNNLPPSGNNTNCPGDNQDFAYGCGAPQITYFLSVVGADNSQDSKTLVVTNSGDQG